VLQFHRRQFCGKSGGASAEMARDETDGDEIAAPKSRKRR